MGRGKTPSENTVRILCGKAAGMCEFEGCNKRLFYDNVTLSQFNNAYVAHIVASSPNGPRGDEVLSPLLSDNLDNLMLMCADHHKLIDMPTTGPRDYPVERLKEMKRNHEEKIENLCNLFYVPKTEIVIFSSPIKGKTSVNIDYDLAAKAVIPEKQPASSYGVNIFVNSNHEYRSKDYWDDCAKSIELHYNMGLYNPYIQFHKADFSVFPIAPIPLIIKLGELIGDKVPCDVFQKTRHPDTWEWQANEITNKFVLEKTKLDYKTEKVAIIISITDDVDINRISVSDYVAVYKIKAENLGVDAIKSKEDLSAFWHLYQEVCGEILNTYGKECSIHLFPAVPVSAAFEIGRRYMPHTYPKITIFEEDEGFFGTITIGE